MRRFELQDPRPSLGKPTIAWLRCWNETVSGALQRIAEADPNAVLQPFVKNEQKRCGERRATLGGCGL